MSEPIMNYRQVSPKLGFGAQPALDQIQPLKELGYTAVVHIDTPEAPYSLIDEATAMKDAGIKYAKVDVSFPEPTVESFDTFRTLLNDNKDMTTYTHCAAGWITCVMVYLYRRVELGEPAEAVDFADVWEPNDRWQAYIDEVLQQHNLSR